MTAVNPAPGNKPRAPRLGYVYVVFAAALWASSGSAAKFLFNSGISPFKLVQLRTTISAALLFIWLFVRDRNVLAVARKDYMYFLMLGIALAIAQFTYLYAISKIHVAAAILLQYQAPVLIAAYTVLVGRKRISLFTVLAILGAILGCYLMVGAYDIDILHMNRAGIISGLASAVAFALYSVRSEYGMQTYKPWAILFYALLFAAFVWNILEPPLSAFMNAYSAAAWQWILFIGLFGTVLPFGLYNEGIKRISATRASITATMEPVMAGVISYSFIGETMGIWQIAGSGLVIGSILLLQIKQEPA
ncbi:MAG: EamA family transporter [Nitrospiraceae bacterium]|nr:MAG: EamA family transporter [Nitrospiraceae bacterium]